MEMLNSTTRKHAFLALIFAASIGSLGGCATIEGAGEDIIVLLIGNKSDLLDERVIDYQTGADFAKQNDLGYYETSAKTGMNVKRAFNTLIDGTNFHKIPDVPSDILTI